MVAVLRVLRQEHADVARLLDMVEAQLGGDGAPDFALLTGILDYFLTYPDQYHHPKKDLIYRPLCRHDARRGPVIDDPEAEITDPTDPLFHDKAPQRLSNFGARIRGHRGAV